jgi:serine-type D-Ala-D-Ala carboxypeptidase (penicillin-binding protein 5/6)
MRSRAALAAAVAGVALAGTAAAPAVATTAPTVVGGERLASHGVVVDAPGATALPRLGASAYLLADLDTGEVLAAKDPHGRLRPASTLKVLTALTLLPKLAPEAVYTARWEDANAEGSRAGLVPDATYTVRQMFQALFLVSGNDAASALANAAGGVPQTVAAMNATAQSLGALDTTVRNPSGLDARGQRTSAYDLAVFARAAMARQDFRDYVTTVKAQFPGKMPKPGKVRKTFEIYT